MNVLLEPMSIPKKYDAVPEHTGSREHFLKRDGKKSFKIKTKPKRSSPRSRRSRDFVSTRNSCLTWLRTYSIL
jgi:hypothetical protein